MRFVIAIPTDTDPAAFARVCAAYDDRADWRSVASTPAARAWVRQARASVFAAEIRPDRVRFGRTLTAGGLPDWGAFVELRLPADGRSASVHREPSGRIPCWRLTLPGVDVYFSDLDDVRRLAPDLAVDWRFLTFHLNCAWTRGPATGFEAVTEVLPGQTVTYDGGRREVRADWSAVDVAQAPFPTVEAAETALREAAQAGVNAWAAPYARVALELSGGLDSAIVLGLLAQAPQRPEITAVNYVIAHSEGDERAFARRAAERHGVRLVEREISTEGLRFSPARAGSRLRPSTHTMPLGYDQVRNEMAAELGVDAYFTGTGGDHLFYESVPAAAVVDALRQRPWGALAASHQLAQLSKDTLWNVLAVGLRAQRRSWRSPQGLLQRRNSFLSEAARTGADFAELAHPVLAAGAILPPGKLQQALRLTELENHFWREDDFPLDDVHPLVSRPLIEASLRIPSYWFFLGGVQRGLARRAFEDLLPPEIRHRRGKSSNTSHWIQVVIANLAEARTLLLEGELARRGLLDRRRLETVLTPLGVAANDDFGGLTTCLVTELWLQAQAAAGKEVAPLACAS